MKRVVAAVVITAALIIGVQLFFNTLFDAIDRGTYKMSVVEFGMIVEVINDYKTEHGTYPVACDWSDLKVIAGPMPIKSSALDEGLLYCSSGESYIAAYTRVGPGVALGGASDPLVVSNGTWYSWPEHASDSSLARIAAFPPPRFADQTSTTDQ